MKPPLSLPIRLARWWTVLENAGRKHRVDPLLLAAIMDRESMGGDTLTPQGPGGTGDHGNGLGLMQIDKRFHKAFVSKVDTHGNPLWTLPEWNVSYAAGILADDLHAFCEDEVRAVAAYNAGRNRVIDACGRISRPFNPKELLAAMDAITTAPKYVSDVLERRRKFTPPKDVA